jgi:hypothetical protein
MRIWRAVAGFWLLASTAGGIASAQQIPNPPPHLKPIPIPSDADCKGLPQPKVPLTFPPGEELEFALDALGAQAGKLTLKSLGNREGQWVVEARAQTNSFFSKVRRVTGVGTSYLNPKTLRPSRYVEDAVENEVPKYSDVRFGKQKAQLEFKIANRSGRSELRYSSEGLDVVGAVYLFRQLDYQKNQSICFDVYGIRKMWRVFGKVASREHVSLPIGEFEAWHLVATAARLDNTAVHRDVHIWISDDGQRLPLAALGTLDVGAVRATLTSIHKPGAKARRAQGKEELKW